jgi:hypothetical protein
MSISLGAAGVAIGALVATLILWWRRQDRQLHPQDFAFAACTSFVSELGLPRDVRIRRVFPSIGDEVMSAWLGDFERLDAEIERLARAGGPQQLGEDIMRDRLRRAFPFLVGRGLRQAVFLVGYSTMHEGYNRAPDPVRRA